MQVRLAVAIKSVREARQCSPSARARGRGRSPPRRSRTTSASLLEVAHRRRDRRAMCLDHTARVIGINGEQDRDRSRSGDHDVVAAHAAIARSSPARARRSRGSRASPSPRSHQPGPSGAVRRARGRASLVKYVTSFDRRGSRRSTGHLLRGPNGRLELRGDPPRELVAGLGVLSVSPRPRPRRRAASGSRGSARPRRGT